LHIQPPCLFSEIRGGFVMNYTFAVYTHNPIGGVIYERCIRS
jgi:hypothetical protein